MKYSYGTNLILSFIFLFLLSIVVLTGTNEAVFMYINTATRSSSFIWANLTILGDTLSACAIMLLFIRRRPDLVYSGIIAVIIATLIVNVLKSVYNLPRPPGVIGKDYINIVGPVLMSHSFPSGHTVTIFVLAGILMFFFRSIYARICLILPALLVGISRIAVGVHWPEDVLAGAVTGILCATAGVYLGTKMRWNRIRNLQLLIGFMLIVSDLYLLFIHKTGYTQAICFQHLFALAILVAGIREYYLLIKEKYNPSIMNYKPRQ